MANIGRGAIGAFTGVLSGGPVGAISGLLGGLFGSDPETERVLAAFTPGQQNILRKIEQQMPGLIASLNPEEVQALADDFTDRFTEEGLRQVSDVFNTKREQLRMDQVRTGGVLGTVGAEMNARLGREESIARTSTINNASIAGQNVAQNVLQGNQRSLMVGQNVTNSIYGNRLGDSGTRQPGALGNDLLAAGFGAATSPYSYANKKGGLNDKLGGRINDWFGGIA